MPSRGTRDLLHLCTKTKQIPTCVGKTATPSFVRHVAEGDIATTFTCYVVQSLIECNGLTA